MGIQEKDLKKSFDRCISGNGSQNDKDSISGFRSFDIPHNPVKNLNEEKKSTSEILQALIRR